MQEKEPEEDDNDAVVDDCSRHLDVEATGLHAFMHACMRLCIHVRIHTYMSTCACVYMYGCWHVCPGACMYARISLLEYIDAYIRIARRVRYACACMYVCMDVCLYVCIFRRVVSDIPR